MRIQHRWSAIALFSALTGCAASDDSPPTLEVTSPERGTLAEGSQVTVTGQVIDDAPGNVQVTVNGVAASVAPDGSFTASLTLTPGIEVIETIATDTAGNRKRDVRAVLSGTLAPSTGQVSDAIGVHIGTSGFAAIGTGIENLVEAMDLTAAVTPMNPVFYDGGCLGAEVNVTGVDISGVDLDLVPGIGAVETSVVVHDLVVDLHATYDVACIGGSSNLTVRADAVRIQGGLGIDVLSGDLRTALRDVGVTIEGFDLDAGGLPGAVLDLIEGVIDDRIADALRTVMTEKVPPMADAKLAEMAGKSWTVPALGRQIAMSVSPTDVDVGPTGAFVAIDTSMVVAGGEGGAYLSTPAPVTAAILDDARGIGLAVADDTLNQLFAGLWASGALEHTLPVERGNPLGLLLDARTTAVTVTMSLPPTVSTAASGDLRVTIGDMIVRCTDEAGEEMSSIAVTVSTTIGADSTETGELHLRLGDPEVYAQVLWQRDDLDTPLEGENVEELVQSVWGIVRQTGDDVLREVPMPSIAGISVSQPSLASRNGFVVVETDLVAN
jgi:hypothetical protein